MENYNCIKWENLMATYGSYKQLTGVVSDTTDYRVYFGDLDNQRNSTINPTFKISTGELKATLLTATSDVTLKSDISTIEDALDKVKKLRGVQYKRKFNNREEIGLIAQECESIIPSLVTGEDSNKSVAYGNITALLIEAIKEQQVMIKELQEKVEKQ